MIGLFLDPTALCSNVERSNGKLVLENAVCVCVLCMHFISLHSYIIVMAYDILLHLSVVVITRFLCIVWL